MRLWHKALIKVLPRQQLLGQWRECCLIAKNIVEKDTPNHILVNKVMDYPTDHFIYYAYMVFMEANKRDYKLDWIRFEKYGLRTDDGKVKCSEKMLFDDWHNDRYLQQCFYNLQEKYDCGGITASEWNKIELLYKDLIIW